jgi:hypothetical protein
MKQDIEIQIAQSPECRAIAFNNYSYNGGQAVFKSDMKEAISTASKRLTK